MCQNSAVALGNARQRATRTPEQNRRSYQAWIAQPGNRERKAASNRAWYRRQSAALARAGLSWRRRPKPAACTVLHQSAPLCTTPSGAAREVAAHG